MITDVENIILNKEYFELTPEELSTVNELVSSAEEYDEMKWFLASTQQALVSEKVEATPELKKNVMDYLHQDEKKRRFWLNSVGVFLWPEEKRFYQRPAFQMSLAALLLIGFIMVYDRPIDEQNMAINDTTIDLEDAKGRTGELDNAEEVVGDGEKSENTEDFGIVDEDKKFEDVLTTRGLASELERSDVDPPTTIVNSLDANVMDMESDDLPQDGYYQGAPSNDQSSADDFDADPKVTSGNANSKSNANNYEPVQDKDQAGNKLVLADEVVQTDSKNDKDNRKKSRDALKKSAFKKGKNKDAKDTGNNGDVDFATTYEEEDVEEIENGGTATGEFEYNNMGNNTSNELNQTVVTNAPVGGANNAGGNFGEGNSQPGNASVDDLDNGKIVLEEKEQQVIKPYQLHIDATKELKSLFKTLK